MSTFLLGYGVVLVKFGQKVQQLKKLHSLTIITLILTLILLSQQLNQDTITDSTILVGNGFLYVNEYSIIIKLILISSSITILLLSLDATILDKIFDYEFSQLILLSTLGIMLLISSRDLIMLYLAIELLSLSFYVLAAIKRDSQHSVEAGLKYFLLGALSSGLLLFGMALIYTFTGETNFDAINQYL
jgi:NADH:ubiquinone oxidoreductase subunit 2 (subunit N)